MRCAILDSKNNVVNISMIEESMIEVVSEALNQNIIPSESLNIGDSYITPEPEEPVNEIELLKQKMIEQDNVIEELLFEIIPLLMEGGVN